MKVNEYQMRMLNIEKLPEKDNPKSIIRMMEEDKYKWREQGLTKQEVKDRMCKKPFNAHIVTGSKNYYHAYYLLSCFTQKGRGR